MSFFSALVGYDVSQSGIKQYGASHYMMRAIVLSKADLEYESTSSFMAQTAFQGVTELEFQVFVEDPVIMLQLDAYEQYDQQLCLQETWYFHCSQQLLLTEDPQMLQFEREGRVIEAQIVVNAISLEKIVRFPLVEISIPDFQFPASKYYFCNFMAVEIQAGQLKFMKHLNGRQGDLSDACIPFVDEILFKLVVVVKILEVEHKFALTNIKIHVEEGICKGFFMSVVDVNPPLDPLILKLVDNIIFAIENKMDEWQGENGVSVKLNLVLTPGFLNRWMAARSPKVVELDLPEFSHPPHLASSENKKLEKLLQTEFVACEDITNEKAKGLISPIKGSIFIYVESSFVPKEVEHSVQFLELEKTYKSIAMVTVVVDSASEGFGFAVLSNKEIDEQKLIQEFEVGSGNIAVCTLAESKGFLIAANRGHSSSIVKLLVNNTKSLIKTSVNGITMHSLVYEKGDGFSKRTVKYSQQMLEAAIKDGKCFIDTSISQFSGLRLYFEDMVYQEKKGISDLPQLHFEEQSSRNRVIATNTSVSSFTKQSLISALTFATPQIEHLEAKKVADYFGGRVGTFFIVEPRRSLATFEDALDEERRKIEEEMRKIAEEKRKAEEELRRLEELRKEEEKKLEAERLAALAEEQEHLQEGDALKDSKAFRDNRRREMDAKLRKIEEEKREREEQEKEELKRKMELKKLRNLKWQQQIERFIVKEKGQIETFYNDRMDEQERSTKQRELQYPRKEVHTRIVLPPLPDTFYICAEASEPQCALSQTPTAMQRCKSELHPSRARFSSPAPVDETTHDSNPDMESDQMLNLDALRTKELLISPISCMEKSIRAVPSRQLASLRNSPLSRTRSSPRKPK